MKDLLPDEIINRPKMGFTLPWTHWMKNELRDFCESNLRELCSRQLFHEKGISLLWQRFLAGDQRASWSRIWHLVILNHWISSNSDYLGD
jgi:asparagine synthase (glutamine-hydrolysing)